MNLSKYQLFLLHYIWNGYLKPVDKLINKKELNTILDDYSFGGKTYSLPFLFPGTTDQKILGCYYEDVLVAGIRVQEVFEINPEEVCLKMFGTADQNHPGVKYIYDMGTSFIAGEILHYDPAALYQLEIPFIEPNFSNEYVFQSRNPPSKAHETIIAKYAGDLLYTTPYETSNNSDYSFEKKIRTYEIMAKQYNVNIFVSLLPRLFGGPREALQNVLLFQNLGINKFIMGRGKNCYKNYHDEHEPIRFCKEAVGADKIIEQENIEFNGKMIRASEIRYHYVDKGLEVPEELMNSEVAKVLYD